MKKLIVGLLLLSIAVCSACTPPERGSLAPSAAPEEATPAPQGEQGFLSREEYPRVDGSTATIPLSVALLAKACGIPQEEAELYVTHSKTNEAYMSLVYGDADLLLAYEPPEEAKLSAEYQHYRWNAQPIGRDALVFLVNEKNPVENLTERQLTDIYSGNITNWSEVGGEDMEIVAFQRDANSGSQTLMNKLVMKGLPLTEAPAEYVPAEMGELIEAISAYDNSANAIGYSVYYYVSSMFQMPGIKMIAVDGIVPSDETIGSGKYPYLNDFFAVINDAEPAGTPTRRLFDYMLSQEGKSLIEACGYVPVR